ncbi:MAG TPA: alpha/beta hydrolase-fold protein [Vicinamibacterales bacterium]|nr:alpha/beta hydrolase-fold protein [Vicinamibacterales bacterium]
MRRLGRAAVALTFVSSSVLAQGDAGRASQASPLTIGETFTIESKILGEARRINVYLPPPPYGQSAQNVPFPVLYMPDGGLGEDFLHVAGLVQVSNFNSTMRPFILVGIENTQRRRDMTGPTQNAEDKKIAPQVGGSAAFRRFIRTELMPVVTSRYRTTTETAIIGESLAGLFIVETFFLEPDLFDTYIAFDPSLWWNNRELVTKPVHPSVASGTRQKTLYLSNSDEKELATVTQLLAARLQNTPPANLKVFYHSLPNETHATIYHPAAVEAFRRLFKPAPAGR